MDNSSGVGVLDKAALVLAALESGPATLAGLVAGTGLARPTAHRLAVALEHHRLVARDMQGTAVACGARRRLDVDSAEIKRMFVLPSHRGTGAAPAVLRSLEAEAVRLGLSVLKLETGPAQPDAIRFYEREGYTLIDNFGPYAGEPLSVCYARPL